MNGSVNMDPTDMHARPNYYQHYAWVSPRGLVRDARKTTRARRIFPSRIATTKFQMHRTLHYTQDEIMRTTGNFVISVFSMMAIVVSLASMVAA